MKMKANRIFFCFHPRFDTGTWSIAAAFTTVVLFSAMFVLALSYSAPKCVCPQIWEQLDVLPATYRVVYIFLLLYLLACIVVSILVIYGAFKAQHKKMPPFIIMMIGTEVATIAASIYAFVQLSKFEEYLLLDNDTYWDIAKMVLKEDLITTLEGMMDHAAEFLKLVLQIDMSESLNLDTLMDATLKEGVLAVLGGMKRMMKLSVILLAIGINIFFITSILVVFSHFNKLKKGTLKSYTGVPGLVMQRVVLSNSVRSTASETLSDWSGMPLKDMQKMKSKYYKKYGSQTNSLYNDEKLEVQGKFPSGGFV